MRSVQGYEYPKTDGCMLRTLAGAMCASTGFYVFEEKSEHHVKMNLVMTNVKRKNDLVTLKKSWMIPVEKADKELSPTIRKAVAGHDQWRADDPVFLQIRATDFVPMEAMEERLEIIDELLSRLYQTRKTETVEKFISSYRTIWNGISKAEPLALMHRWLKVLRLALGSEQILDEWEPYIAYQVQEKWNPGTISLVAFVREIIRNRDHHLLRKKSIEESTAFAFQPSPHLEELLNDLSVEASVFSDSNYNKTAVDLQWLAHPSGVSANTPSPRAAVSLHRGGGQPEALPQDSMSRAVASLASHHVFQPHSARLRIEQSHLASPTGSSPSLPPPRPKPPVSKASETPRPNFASAQTEFPPAHATAVPPPSFNPIEWCAPPAERAHTVREGVNIGLTPLQSESRCTPMDIQAVYEAALAEHEQNAKKLFMLKTEIDRGRSKETLSAPKRPARRQTSPSAWESAADFVSNSEVCQAHSTTSTRINTPELSRSSVALPVPTPQPPSATSNRQVDMPPHKVGRDSAHQPHRHDPSRRSLNQPPSTQTIVRRVVRPAGIRKLEASMPPETSETSVADRILPPPLPERSPERAVAPPLKWDSPPPPLPRRQEREKVNSCLPQALTHPPERPPKASEATHQVYTPFETTRPITPPGRFRATEVKHVIQMPVTIRTPPRQSAPRALQLEHSAHEPEEMLPPPRAPPPPPPPPSGPEMARKPIVNASIRGGLDAEIFSSGVRMPPPSPFGSAGNVNVPVGVRGKNRASEGEHMSASQECLLDELRVKLARLGRAGESAKQLGFLEPVRNKLGESVDGENAYIEPIPPRQTSLERIETLSRRPPDEVNSRINDSLTPSARAESAETVSSQQKVAIAQHTHNPFLRRALPSPPKVIDLDREDPSSQLPDFSQNVANRYEYIERPGAYELPRPCATSPLPGPAADDEELYMEPDPMPVYLEVLDARSEGAALYMEPVASQPSSSFEPRPSFTEAAPKFEEMSHDGEPVYMQPLEVVPRSSSATDRSSLAVKGAAANSPTDSKPLAYRSTEV